MSPSDATPEYPAPAASADAIELPGVEAVEEVGRASPPAVASVPVLGTPASQSQSQSLIDNPQSPIPNRHSPIELAGRLIVAGSLAALVYAVWHGALDASSAWSAKEARVLPRLTVFVLGALMALIVQGGADRTRGRAALLLLGLGAGLGSGWLLGLGPVPGPDAGEAASPAGPAAARNAVLAAQPLVNLLRFEGSLFAAVLLGSWLGRDLTRPLHLVSLLLCAAVGDMWLAGAGVSESVAAGHPLRLLRIPLPAAAGSPAPAFTDLFFVSAVLAGARTLRVHTLSIVLGAFSGYSAGAFLALSPWPAWPGFSMMLLAAGVLIAAWPELKLTLRDAVKASLIALLLLLFLTAMTRLRHKLAPPAQPPPELPRRYMNEA